jgi:hypothetical protein
MIPPEPADRDRADAPYGYAARAYRKNGWLGTLPLPSRAKEAPPEHFTGHGAPYPDEADVSRWLRANGNGNICLRLAGVPDEFQPAVPFCYVGNNVDGWELIGIDVDDYGDKAGAAQLRELEAELGQLPPTVVSSARWASAPLSGTRLFLVPKGYRYKGKAKPTGHTGPSHIDVLYAGLRYLVVWPSVHPTGTRYEFRYGVPGRSELDTYDGVPPIDDVAVLPEMWFTHLMSQSGADADAKSDIDFGELEEWANSTFPECQGEPCAEMADKLAGYKAALDESDSHNPLNNVVWSLTKKALEGHAGWHTALNEYLNHWRDSTLGKRDEATLRAEAMRNINGALAKAKAEYDRVRHGYMPDDKCDGGAGDTDAWAEKVDQVKVGDPNFEEDVANRLHHLRVYREAQRRLDQEVWTPPLCPASAYDQLAEAPPEVDCIFRDLWSGNAQVNAQKKSGKTTLLLNAAAALVTREAFLGRFDVDVESDCRVAYLNMELTKGQFNRSLREMDLADDALKRIVPYHARESGRLDFTNDSAAEWIIEWLKREGISVLLLDPLGAFYDQPGSGDPNPPYLRWWARLEHVVLQAELRGVLIAHHAGYSEDGGNRARGASAMMDKPDVNITYRYNVGDGTYTDAPVDNKRYLSAFGRDVDVREFEIDYNGRTRNLRATGGGGRIDAETERQAKRAWEVVLVANERGEKPNKGELFDKLGWPNQGAGATKCQKWYRHAIKQEWITADASAGRGKPITHATGPRKPHEGWKVKLAGDGDEK